MSFGKYTRQIATFLKDKILERDPESKIDPLNDPALEVLREASRQGVYLFRERNPRIAKLAFEQDLPSPMLPDQAQIHDLDLPRF